MVVGGVVRVCRALEFQAHRGHIRIGAPLFLLRRRDRLLGVADRELESRSLAAVQS